MVSIPHSRTSTISQASSGAASVGLAPTSSPDSCGVSLLLARITLQTALRAKQPPCSPTSLGGEGAASPWYHPGKGMRRLELPQGEITIHTQPGIAGNNKGSGGSSVEFPQGFSPVASHLILPGDELPLISCRWRAPQRVWGRRR